MSPRPLRVNLRVVVLLGVAALSLVGFHAAGYFLLDGFVLDLGSLFAPAPRYMSFVELWLVFGTIATAALSLALIRIVVRTPDAAATPSYPVPTDRAFVVAAGLAALAAPLLLKYLLMNGAPLTDDEGAYRFAARLLATGRLFVPSPPLKEFFDQNFMINDGRLYPAYFVGWPALLAIGERLGVPALANPMLSALTVPPLVRLVQRTAGSEWVPAGVLVFLTSPFIQVAAATDMAHTSCLMALTWCVAMYFRTTDGDASWRHHFGFGFFAALAFFVRPQATVPLLLPVFAAWLVSVMRATDRARALTAFTVPVASWASLFLAVLWLQNGSPFITGYTRYAQYLVDNQFRFTTFGPSDITALIGFNFAGLFWAIGRTLACLFRLNFDLWGWPSSFVLLAFARPASTHAARLFWWMLASVFGLMLFQRDWGIDTFGPVHAFELVLPLLVLTMFGARNLADRLPDIAEGFRGYATAARVRIVGCVVVALAVTACFGFSTVRLRAIRQIADVINRGLLAPERYGLHKAVVFAPAPFVPRSCKGTPSHFVFFRPTNDPDLESDIVWVNDLGDSENLRLIRTLPARDAYVLEWSRSCEASLRRLPTPRSTS
jgi:hypothetical protein